MRILNINFQSIRNKKALLHNLVETTESDIIIGTETWCNNSIHSSEIIPTDQYNIFRNDREGSKGGGHGVLIAVHNRIICSELFKSNNTELIAAKIHHNQRSIILSAFYRPPSLQDMTYTEKIRNDFVHLKTLAKHNSLWIAGDFNLPDINWNKMTIEGSTYPNHINKSFIDIVQDLCIPVNPPPFRGSLPRKSLISRMDWVSCAGDINLPHTPFPPARPPPNKKILTYILRSIFLEIPHLELPR